MKRFLWVLLLGLALAGVLRHAGAQQEYGDLDSDCQTASLRHEAQSDWAGWTCADIDDLIADADAVRAEARDEDEKWGDLVLAFVVVVLAALSSLVGQALIRTVIAFIDSLRGDEDSPFFLSQFRTLVQKARPNEVDVQKMNALARVITGSGITRAIFAVVFALAYLALLTG